MDLSERGKLRMTGDDRKAAASRHVHQPGPEAGTRGGAATAFFLNAQGRILSDANIFVLEDSVLLDTEPETLPKTGENIWTAIIIADDVTVEDVTPAMATIALEGPEARRADFPPSNTRLPQCSSLRAFATERWGERLIARASVTGAPGFLIFVPHSEKGRPSGAVFSIRPE